MLKRIIILGVTVAATVVLTLRADVVTTGLGGGGSSIPSPLPQAMGGTGAGPLTCAAGSYLTSNGTVQSCVAGPSGTLGSGAINNDCTIAAQYGQAITTGKGTVGHCTINITGLTTLGVVIVTANDPGDGSGRFATVAYAAGAATVYVKTGADGAIDSGFRYSIEHL